MRVHLIDGTYELFRHHMGLPAAVAADGRSTTRGVLRSVLDLVEGGATHVGVATDTVIESFRNALWPGYKTGEGIEPALRAQFPLVEEALAALGVTVWGMVEVEADDALATAAARAARDPRVERVVICTPDKDLAQCVVGGRVVQLDRRADAIRDADGVRERFGVPPESIPDYLALVGDSADGFPGLPGWGAKSAATVLARHLHIDAIPDDPADWDVAVRGAARLADSLREGRELAGLFRLLATLRTDTPGVLEEGVERHHVARARPRACRCVPAARRGGRPRARERHRRGPAGGLTLRVDQAAIRSRSTSLISCASTAWSCSRTSSSVRSPDASNRWWAYPRAASPSTTRPPMAESTLRSSAWAHTAPNAPVLAPTTATGMKRNGLLARGREIQSSAFLS